MKRARERRTGIPAPPRGRGGADGGDTPPPRRRKVRWGRLLVLVSAVLVLLSALAAGGAYLFARKAVREIPKAELEDDALAAPDPNAPQNFLVLGTDGRDGKLRTEDDEPGVDRSDTIMIMQIDPGRDRGSVVSIPRDTLVDIPGRGKGKLNTAYSVGGAQLSVKTVSAFTGLKIHHYVEVNFEGLVKVVDALGGVDICTDQPMRDPKINIWWGTAGCHHVDGTTALHFTRSRSMELYQRGKWEPDPTADLGRIKRQQMFLKAVMKKATSLSALTNINEVVKGIQAGVRIDNGVGLESFFDLYERFKHIADGKVEMTTVPGEPGTVNGFSVWLADPEKSKALFASMGAVQPTPSPEGEQVPAAQ